MRSLVAGIQGASVTLARYRPFLDVGAQRDLEAALLAEQFKVFETVVPQTEFIARAAEWSEARRTLDQKYGEAADVVRTLAAEFRERVGLI